MWSTSVVPSDPLTDRVPCFLKTGEIVLPNALFLQAPKEALNDTVLFRCIRCDKFLFKMIVPACFTEMPALENQAVIAANNGHGLVWMQCTKTFDAGVFKGSLCFSGTSSQGELEANNFPVAAVDDSNEVPPSISATGDVSDVSSPTPVGHCGPAAARLNPWPGAEFAVFNLPAIGSYDAVDCTLCHDYSITETQQCPQPAIPVCGIMPNQFQDPVRQLEGSVPSALRPSLRGGAGAAGTVYGKNPTYSSYGSLWKHFLHSSDFHKGEVPAKGRSLYASFRMSMSSTSCPTFC